MNAPITHHPERDTDADVTPVGMTIAIPGWFGVCVGGCDRELAARRPEPVADFGDSPTGLRRWYCVDCTHRRVLSDAITRSEPSSRSVAR